MLNDELRLLRNGLNLDRIERELEGVREDTGRFPDPDPYRVDRAAASLTTFFQDDIKDTEGKGCFVHWFSRFDDEMYSTEGGRKDTNFIPYFCGHVKAEVSCLTQRRR